MPVRWARLKPGGFYSDRIVARLEQRRHVEALGSGPEDSGGVGLQMGDRDGSPRNCRLLRVSDAAGYGPGPNLAHKRRPQQN